VLGSRRIALILPCRKDRAWAFKRRSDGKRSEPATAAGGYFPPPGEAHRRGFAARKSHQSGFASPKTK
jgi:hypothetical protein